MTWKPPLSVKVGPSQFMNLPSPPASSTMSGPGCRYRWYALASTDCAPSSFMDSGSTALTVAFVPTAHERRRCDVAVRCVDGAGTSESVLESGPYREDRLGTLRRRRVRTEAVLQNSRANPVITANTAAAACSRRTPATVLLRRQNSGIRSLASTHSGPRPDPLESGRLGRADFGCRSLVECPSLRRSAANRACETPATP